MDAPHPDQGPDDDMTAHGAGEEADALARRVAELEATVARLSEALEHRAPTAPPSSPPRAVVPADRPDPPSTPADVPDSSLDRRRLLTRAGTAAVGAMIGGAVATVAGASPAAAATATFDTDSSAPALTATTTGNGPAIRATSTDPSGGTAIDVVTGEATGLKVVTAGRAIQIESSTFAPAIQIDHAGRGIASIAVEAPEFSTGVYSVAKDFGLLGRANGELGMGISGDSDGGLAGASGWGVGGAVGVLAGSPDGIALRAAGAVAAITLERFPYDPVLPPPPLRDDPHRAGEIYFDDEQTFWACVADGTPGTWVRLAGPGTAGAFTVLPSPVRVYDTRPDATPTAIGPKTPLTAFQPRQGIALTTNTSGVPTDATAATISVTVANTAGGSPTNPGYLTIYPSDTTWPGTSNLNWTTPDAITAVTTTVALGPDATIAAYASHACDLIIDVIGYHR